MRLFILGLISLCLIACAAPTAETPLPPSPGMKNQPHLPPPNFETIGESDNTNICGGMVASDKRECASEEFCRYTIDAMCGAADAPGLCSPLPEICAQDYNPVCGCDGQTYSNECVAHAKGVSASYSGECK